LIVLYFGEGVSLNGEILLLKNKSVLLAEDDTTTRIQTAKALGMIFGKVFTAEDGEEAYWVYEDESPDLLITDVRMPKKDGLKLIKAIRQNDYDLPIIIMTSFSEKEMLMTALNNSVDAYLIKPVELGSMVDAIRKAMQRVHRTLGFFDLGHGVQYNYDTKELYQNSEAIELGGKEQEFLELLMSNPTATATKDEIAKKLWPLDPICSSAIKNLVLRIRKKIGDDLILSVKSVGYRLNIPSITGK
jgi:two-component system, OmpR family, response regulator VanR